MSHQASTNLLAVHFQSQQVEVYLSFYLPKMQFTMREQGTSA